MRGFVFFLKNIFTQGLWRQAADISPGWGCATLGGKRTDMVARRATCAVVAREWSRDDSGNDRSRKASCSTTGSGPLVGAEREAPARHKALGLVATLGDDRTE